MACGQLCPYHGIHTLPASLPPAASVHRTMLSTPAAGWRFRRGGLPWRLHTCSCLASPLSSSGGEPEYVLNFTRLFFLNVFAALSSFLLVMEMYVLMQKGEAFARGEVPGRCRQEVFHFWTVNSWFRLRHLISPFYTRTHKETVEFAFGMGQGKWRTMPNFSCLIWSMLW